MQRKIVQHWKWILGTTAALSLAAAFAWPGLVRAEEGQTVAMEEEDQVVVLQTGLVEEADDYEQSLSYTYDVLDEDGDGVGDAAAISAINLSEPSMDETLITPDQLGGLPVKRIYVGARSASGGGTDGTTGTNAGGADGESGTDGTVSTAGSGNIFGRDNVVMKTMIVSRPVEVIGDRAFAGIDFDGVVILPDSLRDLGAGAFAGSSFRYDFTMGNGLTEISDGALEGATFHLGLHLPEGLQGIYGGAFRGAKFEQALDIPATVTTLGQEAFAGAAFSQDFVLPSTVSSIGEGAFRDAIFSGKVKGHKAANGFLQNLRSYVADESFVDLCTDDDGVDHMADGICEVCGYVDAPEPTDEEAGTDLPGDGGDAGTEDPDNPGTEVPGQGGDDSGTGEDSGNAGTGEKEDNNEAIDPARVGIQLSGEGFASSYTSADMLLGGQMFFGFVGKHYDGGLRLIVTVSGLTDEERASLQYSWIRANDYEGLAESGASLVISNEEIYAHADEKGQTRYTVTVRDGAGNALGTGIFTTAEEVGAETGTPDGPDVNGGGSGDNGTVPDIDGGGSGDDGAGAGNGSGSGNGGSVSGGGSGDSGAGAGNGSGSGNGGSVTTGGSENSGTVTGDDSEKGSGDVKPQGPGTDGAGEVKPGGPGTDGSGTQGGSSEQKKDEVPPEGGDGKAGDDDGKPTDPVDGSDNSGTDAGQPDGTDTKPEGGTQTKPSGGNADGSKPNGGSGAEVPSGQEKPGAGAGNSEKPDGAESQGDLDSRTPTGDDEDDSGEGAGDDNTDLTDGDDDGMDIAKLPDGSHDEDDGIDSQAPTSGNGWKRLTDFVKRTSPVTIPVASGLLVLLFFFLRRRKNRKREFLKKI